MLRSFFIGLSRSQSAQNVVTHFPPARRTARRFIAGETLDDAVAVVRALNNNGIKGLMNEVGEAITTREEATQAAQDIKTLLHRIDSEGLDASISLKPSHIGLTFGADFFFETVADIVATARQLNNFVEMDMEGSADVEDTLSVFHRLLDTFGGGLKLAVQGYLHRTPADVAKLIAHGGGIRLVKGAYAEPPAIAIQDKREINEAMKRVMEQTLTPKARAQGAFLALGSHDPALIEWLIARSTELGIAKDQFEFQMLQGVRRDEQLRLARMGYQVRVYVPYGAAWYPYFMRRLAERPANVFFMARAMFGG